jgi:hypothetical protein
LGIGIGVVAVVARVVVEDRRIALAFARAGKLVAPLLVVCAIAALAPRRTRRLAGLGKIRVVEIVAIIVVENWPVAI